MCAIAGILNLDHCPIDVSVLRRMNARLRHRGGDDEGYFLVDPDQSSSSWAEYSGEDSPRRAQEDTNRFLMPIAFAVGPSMERSLITSRCVKNSFDADILFVPLRIRRSSLRPIRPGARNAFPDSTECGPWHCMILRTNA